MQTIKKKKILFIITQSELGGAQRWVFDAATHLDKNKYAITVAGGEIHASQELLNKLKEKSIATHPLRHLVRAINPIKDWLACVEIYRLIIKEKPDILQLCSTKSGVLGSIAGKVAGTRAIVYRIGGWAFNDPRPRWQNTLFLWLEKITAPLKNYIIVNSQKGYDEALRYRICPKEKLMLIYNGVDNARYTHPRKPQPSDTLIIGTIANFYPTKGLLYLLQTARILKNQPFVFRIIGDGPEWQTLESFISREKLTNIELIGAVSNPETHLQQYDILVIPSVKEGLPYVLLEAMAAGIPVIATTVGGIPEIIQSGINGILVPPRDPRLLAEQIIMLKRNPELRARIAHAAQETIKKYSLKKMLVEINKIYKNMEVGLP